MRETNWGGNMAWQGGGGESLRSRDLPVALLVKDSERLQSGAQELDTRTEMAMVKSVGCGCVAMREVMTQAEGRCRRKICLGVGVGRGGWVGGNA